MKEKLTLISRILKDKKTRAAYIMAKLAVLVPSQIRALRLRSSMPRQQDLADEAVMQQSRISMFETPGAANVTLETLAWLAAIFKVGVIVKFVPFSEMLRWENSFSQEDFTVTKVDEDRDFLDPSPATIASEVTAPRIETSIFVADQQRAIELGGAATAANYGLTHNEIFMGHPHHRGIDHWGTNMQQNLQSSGGIQ